MAHADHDRRRFLLFLGAAAAASACSSSKDGGRGEVRSELAVDPDTLRRLGPLQVQPGEWPQCTREEALASAWSRAQSLDKPLLVALVAPPRDYVHGDVGTLLGGLLNHGTRDELATLALTELACATSDELERVTGVRSAGDPLCVLVVRPPLALAHWRDRPCSIIYGVPQPVAIDPELDAPLDYFELMKHADESGKTWEQMGDELEANAVRRSTQLHDAIRLALVPNAAALQDLAARARAVVPATSTAASEHLATCPEGLTPGDALASAALVVAAADEPRAARDFLLDKVVEGVRARWVDAPPPGALWGNSTGCGSRIEGVEPQLMVACGMGHVAEHAQRFLCFYELDAAGELR